jgi:hypothetical protein
MSISGISTAARGEVPVFHTYLTIVFGTSAIFLVGFLFTLLRKRKE